VEVHLDTGMMSGQDIVAAVAHGAHFTLVGGAHLIGRMDPVPLEFTRRTLVMPFVVCQGS